MVSILVPVNLVTATESGEQSPDMSFKKDLLAAVHEDIEPAGTNKYEEVF